MCMCGALRRVVICFGWNGVEEIGSAGAKRKCRNKRQGRDAESAETRQGFAAFTKESRRTRALDMGATAAERMQKAKRDPRFACLRGQARNDGFGAT